jgi:hypothetical protein
MLFGIIRPLNLVFAFDRNGWGENTKRIVDCDRAVCVK